MARKPDICPLGYRQRCWTTWAQLFLKLTSIIAKDEASHGDQDTHSDRRPRDLWNMRIIVSWVGFFGMAITVGIGIRDSR